VSENRLLRIFEPKREEVMRGWGKLHNEELHNLYSSLKDETDTACRMRGKKRSAYKVLVGKTPVRGSIHGQGENIRLYLKNIE
jgi:hypothetical protein